jgi:hypothetical protein
MDSIFKNVILKKYLNENTKQSPFGFIPKLRGTDVPEYRKLPDVLNPPEKKTTNNTTHYLININGKHGNANVRYNNPGSQWPSERSERYGSMSGAILRDAAKNRIAFFPNPAAGGAANMDLFGSSIYRGMKLLPALQKWRGKSSGSAGTDLIPKGYVGDWVVGSEDMDIDKKDVMIDFFKKMAKHEGTNILTDSDWEDAWRYYQQKGYQPTDDEKKEQIIYAYEYANEIEKSNAKSKGSILLKDRKYNERVRLLSAVNLAKATLELPVSDYPNYKPPSAGVRGTYEPQPSKPTAPTVVEPKADVKRQKLSNLIIPTSILVAFVMGGFFAFRRFLKWRERKEAEQLMRDRRRRRIVDMFRQENQSRIRRASNDKALQIQLAKELEQVLSLTT